MPLNRPACLRPMLKREEYRQFAQKINARMEWTLFSWEALAFFVISLLAPPLSSYLMVRFHTFVSGCGTLCAACSWSVLILQL